MTKDNEQLKQLKEEYNDLITLAEKAVKWFENDNITIDEQSEYIGDYEDVLNKIVKVTLELKTHGVHMTREICSKGFII